MRYAVLGAGRGSAELIDFLRESGDGAEIVALDDRFPGLTQAPIGAPLVGTLERAAELAGEGYRLVSGIANSRESGIRLAVFRRTRTGLEAWPPVIHPRSTVSASATVEAGAVVYPGARVATGARVGKLALIYYNAVVHHDCEVGDGAILCAGALLAGGVVIGESTYVGIGAVVRDGVRVGRCALIGMGAVVTGDVGDNEVVAGVPARPLHRERK